MNRAINEAIYQPASKCFYFYNSAYSQIFKFLSIKIKKTEES